MVRREGGRETMMTQELGPIHTFGVFLPASVGARGISMMAFRIYVDKRTLFV